MPKPWEVLATHTTFKDRWVTLRTDRCVTENGHVLENFHILEYPDWIAALAITKAREIISVREYRHGARNVVTGLIGGAVDPNETPEQCARRELLEETGYTGGKIFSLGSGHPNPANQTNLLHSYLLIDVEVGGQTKFDIAENIEVLLTPFDQFLRNSLKGANPFESLHIATFYQALSFVLRSTDPDLQSLKSQSLREINAL